MDSQINKQPQQAEYFTVSTAKLSKMYLLTLGVYGIYWFYKNWQLKKAQSNLNIMPIPRSLFSIFFTHSLFKSIAQSLKNMGDNNKFNANLLANIYVVVLVVSSIIGKVGELENYPNILQLATFVGIIFSVYPLLEAQDAINKINGDPLGLSNDKYTWHNIMFMVLGSFMWVISLLALFVLVVGK